MKKLIIFLFLSTPAFATNYTVKAAGGGNFTTISACLAGMAAGGDTCTVFAGDYSSEGMETTVAGASGNYNVINVNGSDAVTVRGFKVNSHVKIIGNCTPPATAGTCGFTMQNPSSPNTVGCIQVQSGVTDYYVTNNVLTECNAAQGFGGGSGLIQESNSTFPTFGYYIQNTLSWPCSTPAAQVTCRGMTIIGDHKFIEGNDISHTCDAMDIFGQFVVVRGNTVHDHKTSDCGSDVNNSENHIDFIEANPSTGHKAQNYLVEGNTITNWSVDNSYDSAANHAGLLQQCSGTCGISISRFNVALHIGGGATTNDTQSWPNVKLYNNTWADMFVGGHGSFVHNMTNATGGANLNEIYYFTNTQSGWTPYSYGASPVSPNYGYALGFCTDVSLSTCSSDLKGHNGGAFTSDTGNQVADPQFVSYPSGDLHLRVGSPALNAGINLTTANGSGTSSTTLIVNDSSYFQDGWGLPAGAGFGQMTPDCISVTTVTNHVCITAGGINYSTNTITLATAITWSSGDKVWLYSDSKDVVRLTGSAPNMGAFGFEVVVAPPPATPGVLLMAGSNLPEGTNLP